MAWKAPTSDGGSPIKSYIIEKKARNASNWSKVDTVDANTLSVTAMKLMEDTPYMFRVIAVNEEGQSQPLEADNEVVPKAPPGQ